MERFKIPDDQPMEASILSRQIENAQKKVEEQNFVSRKNVLKYDDVMNTQRMVIYDQRRGVLEGDDLSDEIRGWIEEVVATNVAQFTRPRPPRTGTWPGSSPRCGRCTEPTSRSTSARRGRRREPRGAGRGVRRRRARHVRRARGVVRIGVPARDRALRDPPDRRHALARAPRVDGLPARGRPPARDGAEGPLVEYRGEGHVMFEDLSRAIREESCSRSSTSRCSARTPSASSAVAAPEPLAYEHESVQAPGRSPPPAAGAATALAAPPTTPMGTPKPVVNEHRDIGRERPVLVRLRQEVQALPRRVAAFRRLCRIARCRLRSGTCSLRRGENGLSTVVEES